MNTRVPSDSNQDLHRSGRSGRSHSEGSAGHYCQRTEHQSDACGRRDQGCHITGWDDVKGDGWKSGDLNIGDKYDVTESIENEELTRKYTLITTGDSKSTTEIKNIEIDADGESAALINKYEHKKSNLTVTKTFTGLDEADEAIAKAALVITVSGPNINPTPAEGETKDVKVVSALGRC